MMFTTFIGRSSDCRKKEEVVVITICSGVVLKSLGGNLLSLVASLGIRLREKGTVLYGMKVN